MEDFLCFQVQAEVALDIKKSYEPIKIECNIFKSRQDLYIYNYEIYFMYVYSHPVLNLCSSNIIFLDGELFAKVTFFSQYRTQNEGRRVIFYI